MNLLKEFTTSIVKEECLNEVFPSPTHWLFCRVIKKDGPFEKDFQSPYEKRKSLDSNYKFKDCDEIFISINRLLNNFDLILKKYLLIKRFSPMNKRAVLVFQLNGTDGFIYRIDDKEELHYNFLKSDTF